MIEREQLNNSSYSEDKNQSNSVNPDGFVSKIFSVFKKEIIFENKLLTPLIIMITITAIVFIVDITGLLILPLMPVMSPIIAVILHAIFQVVFLSPILYVFLLKPLVKHMVERKNVLDEMRSSKELLKATIESSADGILAVNEKGKVDYANKRFAQLWRISDELIASRDDKKLLEHVLNQLQNPQQFLLKVEELYNSSEGSFDMLDFKDGRIFERYSYPLMNGEKISGRVWSFRDITERKQVEKALRESEEKHRRLVNAITDMVFTLDKQGKFTYLNHKFEEITGFPADDYIGHHFTEVLIPEYIESTVARFKRGIAGEKIPLYEIELIHKDGGRVPVELNVTSLLDAGGKGIGRIGIARDITERKQAEKALQESEDRLRTMLDTIQTGVAIIDPETHIIHEVNAAAEEMIGISKEQIIGKICHDFICPSEKGKCPVTDLGQSIDNSECVLLKANGESIPVIKTVTTVMLGDSEYLLDSFVDISDRKEAEEKLKQTTELLQSIFNSATEEIIITTDPRGMILSWNEGAKKLLGYEPEDVIGKENIRLFQTEEHLKNTNFEQKIKEMRTTKRPYLSELTFKAKDGKLFPALLTVNPRFDENGEFIGMLGMANDISDRKQTEEKLRKYTEDLKEAKDAQEQNSAKLALLVNELEIAKLKAEEALQAKSDFLARMSHEIRTPMNGIIGITELCLNTKLDEEQLEYLGMVKSSADQLLRVINDILDFSKIEAGKFELESIDFSLHDTIESAMEPLSIRAYKKGIELITFIDPLVLDKVIGDPVRLNQIIINLVGNAVKFTSEGEIVLHVELEAGIFPPQFHFSISDTGIGIAEDKQAEIFASFTQEDGSTTRKYGGTGLGTTIAKQLIEMMGGQIRIESPTNDSGVGGPGCTFHFTVPFDVQRNQKIPAVLEPTDMTNKKALIVDDNATNRHLFKAILENWNLKPSIAINGKQALEALTEANNENDPYDLVLLDVMIPEMDGFETAEKIQSNGWLDRTAIVMLSSSRQPGELNKARKLGVSAFLRKPIRQSALYDAIIKALNRNSVLDEEEDNADMDNKQIKDSHSKETLQILNILLAEDSKVNQLLAIKLLSKHGHTVKAVENGKLAVEALKQDNFDVVLMDVKMPVMDGYEATRTIRELESKTGKHILIIAMTAHAMKGDREKCLKAGMDDYISKPINPDKLYSIISNSYKNQKPMLIHTPVSQPDETGSFNYTKALKNVDGDTDLFKEITNLFMGNRQETMNKIQKAITDKNGHHLEHAAHSLKGMVGNFAAQPAYDIALKLEILGKNGVFDNAEILFKQLQSEIEKLGNELTKYKKVIS